jgi:hypothetical protein
MKLAKEPKEVDFIIKSEPWTEKELADFRELMQKIKRKNKHNKNSDIENLVKKNQNHKVV